MESERPAVTGGAVDPKLLELLVCPLTKAPLRYDRERGELISDQAALAYPIRDGIPIMLVDEARPVGEEDRIPPELRADDPGR
jgi:uncharacterized protein YbaR (Trm112 family)